MKVTSFVRFALALTAVLLATSCASAPPKAAEPVDPLTASREASEQARAKALEVRADVAAKEAFDGGEASFASAKALEAEADSAGAQSAYDGAAVLFNQAFEVASVKRQAAIDAMNKAEEERLVSEEVLTKAEQEQNGEDTSGEE
ncbi:MAG: hypothetical protein JW875_02260 [Spirochaetales bacterium]|nr:hypothetical protein [Spirochaetales bacterium]